MCGWTGKPSGAWQVGKAPGGPVVDFSEATPSGKYLWVNETIFSSAQSISSPTFTSAGPGCTFTGEYFVSGDIKYKHTVKV